MDAIAKAEKIVITTHRSPDGDALGSSLALYHFLKRRNKNVKIIVPNSFPYFLKWMAGAREIEVYEYNPAAGQHILMHADLIFSLDYNKSKEWEIWDLSWIISCKKILIYIISSRRKFRHYSITSQK